MAAQLLGIKTRFTNDLGSPLVGGQVYTYFAGTSTNQDSYSDAALTVPNTNPVILDDTGSADIFLKGSYRIRVFDKSGRFIEEQDNVTQAASQSSTDALSVKVDNFETEVNKVKLDTGITVVSKNGSIERPLSEKNSESDSFKGFGAIGNGVDDDTAAIDSALSSGVNIVSTTGDYLYAGDIDALYANKPSGSGFIIYNGYKYPVKPESRINHLWQGALSSWQMGNSDKVSTVQRKQIPAGVTHARRGFVVDTTIYHVNGNYGAHAIKVARNATTTNTATHNMVITLTPSETMLIAGQTCTLMYHCAKGANYADTNITVKVQASKELMQPILRDDGKYTGGNIDLITKSHKPILRPQSAPYLLTFDVPEDASQLSISIDIPFTGAAGVEDWVEFEQMCLAVSDTAFVCVDESDQSIQNKAATRYQSTYQSGIGRGAPIEGGSVQAICSGTGKYAVAISVRFEPPMAYTPWFTFQSPTSGTEFRLLNKTTGANINGQAYDLTNKGVVITNNATVVTGDRLLCHWTAESLI
ncbi:hypothetical protein [Psychrobacter sp. K31L]|uniref:hypothetical protein n=1 Tax=Psychrobacter sp. K31L TaxID=2820758 RepID=UPI001B31CB3C|nr:hypothetical protein [Psychrobacter sp. K31L]MBP3945113.1 hypothetical protein [Psychrobacter sp. K31L]